VLRGLTVTEIELEPRYSTRDIPGRCIKCLAEHEYGDCLRDLLRGVGDNPGLERRYEALVSFLESPELQKLRAESEKCLAEGKDVKVVLHLTDGGFRYEIKLNETT
jgi:hypothetical protein